MKYSYIISNKVVDEYSLIHNTTVIKGKNNTGKTSILKRIYHCLFGNMYNMVDNSKVCIEYRYKKDAYKVYRHNKYTLTTLNIKYPYDKILIFKLNNTTLLWELLPMLNNVDAQNTLNRHFNNYKYCFLFKDNDKVFTYEALCDIFGLPHENTFNKENKKLLKAINKEITLANDRYLFLLNTNISIKRRNSMLERHKEERLTALYSSQEELYVIKKTIENKITSIIDKITAMKLAALEYSDNAYLQYSYSKELNDADILMYRHMIIQCNKAIDTLNKHKTMMLTDNDNEHITERLLEITSKIIEYKARIDNYKGTIDIIKNTFVNSKNSTKLYDLENGLKVERNKLANLILNIEGVERNIEYLNTIKYFDLKDTSEIEASISLLKEQTTNISTFDNATHRTANIEAIRTNIRALGLTTINRLSSQQYLEAFYIIAVHIRKGLGMVLPIFIDSEYILTDTTNISSLLNYNHTVLVTNKKFNDNENIEYITLK